MVTIIVVALICSTIIAIVYKCNENKENCCKKIIKKINLKDKLKDEKFRTDFVELLIYSDGSMKVDYYNYEQDGPY